MLGKELGVAVIGSGRMGRLWASLSSTHPAVGFLGVADISEEVAKMLGNDVKQTFKVSLLPILIGLVAGFIIGQIPLDLPVVGHFQFGTTGGRQHQQRRGQRPRGAIWDAFRSHTVLLAR